MVRAIIAAIAGYAAWTLLWLGGNVILFAEAAEAVKNEQMYDKTGPLLGVLVLSIICSTTAGMAVAAIARKKPLPATAIMATLLLLTGIGVQLSVWSLMPVWYHLAFLILIAPMCALGAILYQQVMGPKAA